MRGLWFSSPEIIQARIVVKDLNIKVVITFALSLAASLVLLTLSTLAGHHEGGEHAVAAEQMGDDAVWASGARAIVAEVEGEVIAVDMATREVVVRSPAGNFCHADRPRRRGGSV